MAHAASPFQYRLVGAHYTQYCTSHTVTRQEPQVPNSLLHMALRSTVHKRCTEYKHDTIKLQAWLLQGYIVGGGNDLTTKLHRCIHTASTPAEESTGIHTCSGKHQCCGWCTKIKHDTSSLLQVCFAALDPHMTTQATLLRPP